MKTLWKILQTALLTTVLGACTMNINTQGNNALGYVAPLGYAQGVTITNAYGGGSGVWISPRVVITAKHVVVRPDGSLREAGLKVTPLLSEKSYSATVLEYGDGPGYQNDWALLLVEDGYEGPVADVACRPVVLGEEVVGIGNPLLLPDLTAFYGVVSNTPYNIIERMGEDPATSQFWRTGFLTTMRSAPGVSGGAVYDSTGKVIGLMVGALSVQTVGTILQFNFPIVETGACNTYKVQ